MIPILIALFIGLINVLYFFVIVKGYPIDKHPSDDYVQIRGVRLTSEKFSAGVIIYFMGAISLISWTYFMYIGFNSFLNRAGHLLPHVLLQLGASLYMIIAGHAVLRAWRRNGTVFFTSIAVAILAAAISMFSYGKELHGGSMHVFSAFVQVGGSIFAAAVYLAGLIFIEER